MDFPEADWKRLRAVHPIALERYSERVLDEAGAIMQPDDTPAHERYVHLVQFLRESSREMSYAFDDMRRSTAMHRLAAMVGLHLLTDAELNEFSPDTRSRAVSWSAGLSQLPPSDVEN